MGLKNRIHPGYLYYLTLTVVDWVDVFTRPTYKHLLLESVRYCQKEKGLELYAWCLMTNHIHFIASAKEGSSLSDVLRDFKKYTNKVIINAIQQEPESRRVWLLDRFAFAGSRDAKIQKNKFWQEGNEAKEIHSNAFLEQKLEYIHQNPVKAEIATEPEHYLYSSARDYAGEKGLLDIILLQ
ncbi:transposase [Pontibacter diazotrophicus]|uniref:Transposase n=1 Tax=Pontibacter diazotrophicus TaxID=1400979 RepID=A0A3D8LC41_9BACT|nr:transposase [Pontibacter diazotrophicus]RDV14522.1 transposase [Pontibacter diazotrophicus]